MARAWQPLVAWFERVSAIGSLPGDDHHERVRKGVLVWFGLCLGLGAPMDSVPALEKGDTVTAAIGILNGVVVLLGFAHFALTRRRGPFQTLALAMTLLVPGVMHVLQGGFIASGGMLMWSSLAPLGALLLLDVRAARWWMLAFLLVASVALWLPDHVPAVALIPENKTPMWSIVGLVIGYPAMVSLLVWYFVKELEKARANLAAEHAALEVEQAKSEGLLLNILPAPVAARLKDDGSTIADGFAEVSVLFADIVGFTVLSAQVSPGELVQMLDQVFARFDALADKHGIEKIKTIGDAYMAASGLPEPRADHAEALASMALDMRAALRDVNTELGTSLDIRIGLHTGPVVAGVIGTRKFIYDLWGDTVNTASRMESHGEPSAIHVSEPMAALLRGRFSLEERGENEVKGKGRMRTFFLLGRGS